MGIACSEHDMNSFTVLYITRCNLQYMYYTAWGPLDPKIWGGADIGGPWPKIFGSTAKNGSLKFFKKIKKFQKN